MGKKEKGKCDCCGEKVSLKKLNWDDNHCAFVCDDCLILGSFDDDDFASDHEGFIDEDFIWMIEKEVKSSGNSGRIYLPPNWVGHTVKIIKVE